MMKHVVTLGTFAAAVAVVAAIACSSDSVASPTKGVNTAAGANGSDSTGGSPGDSSAHGDSSGSPRWPWLTITPNAASLQVGNYLELHATLYDTTGAPVSAHVTWRSSDPRIATVGDSGLVHGVALGVVAIFASANGVNDSAEVAIVDSVVPPSSPPPPSPPPADSGIVPDSTPGSQPPPPPPPSDTVPPRDTLTLR